MQSGLYTLSPAMKLMSRATKHLFEDVIKIRGLSSIGTQAMKSTSRPPHIAASIKVHMATLLCCEADLANMKFVNGLKLNVLHQIVLFPP